jgi:hypothetical protein
MCPKTGSSRQWKFHEIAAGFAKADQPVRVAALLTVIGEEAVEIFETFERAKHDVLRMVSLEAFGSLDCGETTIFTK